MSGHSKWSKVKRFKGAIEYIDIDEYVEATHTETLRLRKRILDATARKRAAANVALAPAVAVPAAAI